MPRDELSRTSPLLLLYLQVTLFVYSDLLLFTKEDEPGRCNVLRNPLYLHSVKLQEGECLQQQLGAFWGFSGCYLKGFWPAAGEHPAVLVLPVPPNGASRSSFLGCRARFTPAIPALSWQLHLLGHSGALRPSPGFLGLRIWAAILQGLFLWLV